MLALALGVLLVAYSVLLAYVLWPLPEMSPGAWRARRLPQLPADWRRDLYDDLRGGDES